MTKLADASTAEQHPGVQAQGVPRNRPRIAMRDACMCPPTERVTSKGIQASRISESRDRLSVGHLAIVVLELFSYPLQVHPGRNCLDEIFHCNEVKSVAPAVVDAPALQNIIQNTRGNTHLNSLEMARAAYCYATSAVASGVFGEKQTISILNSLKMRQRIATRLVQLHQESLVCLFKLFLAPPSDEPTTSAPNTPDQGASAVASQRYTGTTESLNFRKFRQSGDCVQRPCPRIYRDSVTRNTRARPGRHIHPEATADHWQQKTDSQDKHRWGVEPRPTTIFLRSRPLRPNL
ncbi:hypothetical protein C8R46DRAFT_1190706 [Mycena filopes]|nr:hypothetical protein C8R46DRAFT_1190706 [Mycena filopes]